MKIRLWRVFSLFRRDVLLNFLTLGAIFFLIPLILLALTQTLVWWTLLGLVALNLIWVLTYLLGCPSSLRMEGDRAEFTEYYEVRKGDHKRLHFIVTAIRQVEYRQTAFERLFDIGRIRFRGDAEVEPSGILPQTGGIVFEIAGIPHFRDFRAERSEAEMLRSTQRDDLSGNSER